MCPTNDLLVIGGGINGLGIAADAAQRGLSVLLVEKTDFGAGTTAASSRLIHGGLRYLQYGEVGLVRESLRERRILLHNRPHLVRPIELLIPEYRGGPLPGWKIGLGLRIYNWLARDPAFPRSRALTAEEALERQPGLDPHGLLGGHVYGDAQIEFPERLCIELMRETEAAGGECLNHTRVVGLHCQGDRVTGALLRDEFTGSEWEIGAQLTINAAGPWVDVVNRLLPEPPRRLIGGTWGSHIVLPLREGGPQRPLYATARKDGRPFFLLPWDGRLLVGTTDVPFEGDPDTIHVPEGEVEYLLAETNRLFPEAAYQPEDVQYCTIGVRPLPASDRSAAAVTRRHFLVDHEKEQGVSGLASVVGGKLTTYRSLAEEVVDWSFRALNRPFVPSATASASDKPARGERVPARLMRLYADPQEVFQQGQEPLTPGSAVLRGEALHAIGVEKARTVEDVLLRRIMRLPPTEEERRAVTALLAARL
jgi:glycerol-3-phosphate dehydrogenase